MHAPIYGLTGLKRRWDRRVIGSRKLPIYEQLHADFPTYLSRSTLPCLHELLHWLQSCVNLDMGVFLVY
ncbi:hypothetical protein LOC68_08305 [Blastopirellula sp. JC732]|uniref:Uncharacterized protein n=1 Tax=Blastopirellula sediminis TaxID=2894196 RepID=A0A9X1SIT0_9BACT|nr:hypothetical protein [Blastopirellula sediminis]MCC9608829.1 hypothetical protein [Blastopirellula sediminis]MCC9628394.1 hypothetical protein [Blastopirellula sediminis]